MISRRNFLRKSLFGAGALTFTPSFNYLFGANSQSGLPPHRFIFMRKSNGNLTKLFSLPTFSEAQKTKEKNKEAFEADLDKHELPDWLKCLDKHKEDMTVLQGVSMMMANSGHSSFTGCMGLYQSGRNVISKIKRASIDFELAKLFPSPYGHIELSLASAARTVQWRAGIVPGFSAPAPQQRNYCYADPQTAHNELFKSVTNSSAVDSENSMLEYLQEKEKKRLGKMSALERMKMANHINSLGSVRQRNKNVANLSGVISKHLPKIDKIHANGGPNATLVQKWDAFSDILVATMVAGLSNVITYTLDDLNTPITSLPKNNKKMNLHNLGHSQNTVLRDHVKECHMNQVERIVTKLKAVPEGNGTMFDNTTIIYMPETGAGHHGPNTEAPMVIMSGKNSRLDIAGRYIRLPFHKTEGHKTLGNWYTSLLNAYGNPIGHYGDLDNELVKMRMPQTGNIKRFMQT